LMSRLSDSVEVRTFNGVLIAGHDVVTDNHMVMIFFFQAEDGIRDWSVTGVQTCALPISHDAEAQGERHCAENGGAGRHHDRAEEIGRASCRERVEISGVGESLKE